MARVAAAALVVLAAAVPALAGAHARRTPKPHTQVHIYEPFHKNGRPAVKVGRVSSGTCSGPSKLSGRADAWRCETYDPCFSSARANRIVLCPIGPWEPSVIELKLPGRLTHGHRAKPSTRGLPWAIETTLQAQCTYVTGTTRVVDGLRANYFCGGNMPWLWGRPSRRTLMWKIYAAPFTATRISQHAQIASAWF